MSGRIKLHRQSQENPLYFAEPFTKWQARQDLLLIANHADGFFFVRWNKIEVKRWQVARGENDLCQRWKWSRDKIRNFLKLLENMWQIIQQKNRICSIYIIVNYDRYQTTDQTTDPTTEKQQTLQQKNINKKKENEQEKKERKFVPPSLQEVTDYFFANGYSREVGERAWNWYSVADRHDTNGKPILNRKQKMNNVRFKPANKGITTEPQDDKEKWLLYVQIGRKKYTELFGLEKAVEANRFKNIYWLTDWQWS